MKNIFTIGYEGANLEDFIATLATVNVDMVLDIRELAISRRKGFSKTALKNRLELAGIAYLHEKALGAPKIIRHRLRVDLNYKTYFIDFENYINTQHNKLLELAQRLPESVVLLCYERDYKLCHRSVVAAKFSEILGSSPKHLGVVQNACRNLRNDTLLYIGQSLSAA